MNNNSCIYIYKHTNIINGKSYVGQTNNIIKRFYGKGKGYIQSRKFYPDIIKYGWDNFTHEILCKCSVEDADDLERYYIALFNCIENGYNLNTGGKSNYIASEDTIRLLSKSHKGQHSSPETEFKKGNGAKQVYQYDKDNILIQEWNCIRDAGIELNICTPHISDCCRGKRKTAGGYIWKYKESD